jgi:OOP family OmpA-OmpF porin
MRGIVRVSLFLGALTAVCAACAHSGQTPPNTVAATAAPTATPAPPPPAWPDAAPAPEAPAPDAAGPVPAPGPTDGFAVNEHLPDVHFGSGRIQVQAAERKTLDAAAAWLKANPTQIVIVEGHTDAAGPQAANRTLAQQRAAWVMAYLVGRGVAASRITVVSRGETGALCADRGAACQGQNRRVRFLVRDTGSPQVSASPNP